MPAEKPNILVIFGDAIGITNLSCYSSGVMGYETPPHRPAGGRGAALPALLRRAELHGRARGVPDRPARPAQRPDEGRLPRRADGHEPARPLDRRPLEEPGLRHRPIRQEPRRRPQRDTADVNGFDEFFGNLYHLNAEEEPGAVYGAMQEVFDFAATFKEFPPRSFPPSFVPSTIMEEILGHIKEGRQEAADEAAKKRGMSRQ